MHKKILLPISIMSILFFSSLFSYLYNLNYYDKKYQQYNVYDRFSREQALSATENLFGFFKSNNELDTDFFNEQEISHLSDVKLLIQKANILYYSSIIIFWIILLIYYLKHKKHFVKYFSKVLFYSGICTISLLLITVLIYIATGFNFLFLKFHEVFFVGNYSFDPNISNMKALFPDEFFFDISLAILTTTIMKALFLIVLGLIINRKLFKQITHKPSYGRPTN